MKIASGTFFLSLVIATMVLACVCVIRALIAAPPLRSQYRPRIEVALSPTNGCDFKWGSNPGRYEVSIGCDVGALPAGLVESGFAQRNPQGVKWDASLEISKGSQPLVATNSVLLKAGFSVENTQYYRVAVYDLNKPGTVEVRLASREACPLGSPVFLDIRPSPLQHNKNSWAIWNVISAISLVVLILYTACKVWISVVQGRTPE